jgi:hypothetical protein
VNSILWNNRPDEIATGFCGEYEIIWSDVGDIVPGLGNIQADPGFLNILAGDYRLQSDSPCIDAGDGNNAPLLDIEGNTRYDNAPTINTGTGIPEYTDIGAFEYVP